MRAAVEASNNVNTGMLLLCHQPATVLFDPGSIFSYVFIYFDPRLAMRYESLAKSIHISNPVGERVLSSGSGILILLSDYPGL